MEGLRPEADDDSYLVPLLHSVVATRQSGNSAESISSQSRPRRSKFRHADCYLDVNLGEEHQPSDAR